MLLHLASLYKGDDVHNNRRRTGSKCATKFVLYLHNIFSDEEGRGTSGLEVGVVKHGCIDHVLYMNPFYIGRLTCSQPLTLRQIIAHIYTTSAVLHICEGPHKCSAFSCKYWMWLRVKMHKLVTEQCVELLSVIGTYLGPITNAIL